MARNVKLNLEPSGKFDSSDRAQTGDTTIGTRYNCSVEFDALWDASTCLAAIRTAFLAGSAFDAAVLDGTSSARGVHGWWAVA